MNEDMRPSYYGSKNGIEVFDVIDSFDLDFYSGNVVKYLLRAGRKDPSKRIEDLVKARTYLNRIIERESKNV